MSSISPATSGNKGRFITYPGAFIVEDTTNAISNIPWGRWRPNYPPGINYWSNQGNGTISAQNGVFDNGSRLNDHVFDRAFDGRVAPGDALQYGGRRTLDIAEMGAFTKEHRHLPPMKGRAAWDKEGGFSLGDLTNQLWTTTETNALYVTRLNDRLNVLEMLTDNRPLTAEEFKAAKEGLTAMGSL